MESPRRASLSSVDNRGGAGPREEAYVSLPPRLSLLHHLNPPCEWRLVQSVLREFLRSRGSEEEDPPSAPADGASADAFCRLVEDLHSAVERGRREREIASEAESGSQRICGGGTKETFGESPRRPRYKHLKRMLEALPATARRPFLSRAVPLLVKAALSAESLFPLCRGVAKGGKEGSACTCASCRLVLQRSGFCSSCATGLCLCAESLSRCPQSRCGEEGHCCESAVEVGAGEVWVLLGHALLGLLPSGNTQTALSGVPLLGDCDFEDFFALCSTPQNCSYTPPFLLSLQPRVLKERRFVKSVKAQCVLFSARDQVSKFYGFVRYFNCMAVAVDAVSKKLNIFNLPLILAPPHTLLRHASSAPHLKSFFQAVNASMREELEASTSSGCSVVLPTPTKAQAETDEAGLCRSLFRRARRWRVSVHLGGVENPWCLRMPFCFVFRTIVYSRAQTLASCSAESLCEQAAPLSPLSLVAEASSEGGIFTSSALDIRADFANKSVGGGILARGSLQEEIFFAVCPELLFLRPLHEVLGEGEAAHARGIFRFSQHCGFGSRFRVQRNRRKGPETEADAVLYGTESALDVEGVECLDETPLCVEELDVLGADFLPRESQTTSALRVAVGSVVAALDAQRFASSAFIASSSAAQEAEVLLFRKADPASHPRRLHRLGMLPQGAVDSRYQFSVRLMLREVKKVLAALHVEAHGSDSPRSFTSGECWRTPLLCWFKQTEHVHRGTLNHPIYLSLYPREVHVGNAFYTGNWGCGCFNGDPQLKFLLQWVAVSLAGRELKFFAWSHPALLGAEERQCASSNFGKKEKTSPNIRDVQDALGPSASSHGLSVGAVWRSLMQVSFVAMEMPFKLKFGNSPLSATRPRPCAPLRALWETLQLSRKEPLRMFSRMQILLH